MLASPIMVIPESLRHLGYQICVLKVFCRNFRFVFSHQVCESRNKGKLPLYNQVRSFYDLFHASRVELRDQWGHSAQSTWNSASQIHFVVLPADVLAAQNCIEKK